MDNYNYPMGADTPDAPWNIKENPPLKVRVAVSLTIDKEFEIVTSDYERDDLYDTVDFPGIAEEIKLSTVLPHEAAGFIDGGEHPLTKENLSGWTLTNIDAEVLDYKGLPDRKALSVNTGK